MAKRKPPEMMGNGLCIDCMSYRPHPNGRCGHDCTKACPGCGEAFGLLTARMVADVCFRCERARGGEV